MNVSKRQLWVFGAIAIAAIILITLLAAPTSNRLNSGSTYNRAPDGYGAWYAFMSERGTPVNRWRKPFEDLAKNKNAPSPTTLLRVQGGLTGEGVYGSEQEWVKQGNTLVILGVRRSVTEASYSTRHRVGKLSVKIDTQRRNNNAKEKLLGDRFGAIVWQESIGKGKVIYSVTPYLAANAYQDFPGNYEFLAKLVTQPGVEENSTIQNSVWVDEYLHGYKDAEVLKREQEGDVFRYLAKTAVFPAFIQGLILLLIAIWAINRRFGKPLTLSAPIVDNSEAYIQALAGVLQKANSSEFILDVVGKEELLQLQKALVLGQEQLNPQSLVDAWVKQTGRPAIELEQLLQMQSRKRRMSDTDLLSWLGKWEQIHHHLSSNQTDS